ARLMAARAHEKKLELTWEVRPEVPDALLGDANRLRQVLLALIGNAIKFTDAGEVSVSVGLQDPYSLPGSDQRFCDLRFAVRDTGIGVPADKQEAIFEPFVQADGSMTRKHGGTGLGLAIARSLLELMGGRIGVRSEPGKGSEFF